MKRGMQKCRPLEVREIARLLAACRADKSWIGERDELLFLMLALRGLRASEPKAIKKKDVMTRNRTPKGEFTIPQQYTKKQHGNCLVVLPGPVQALAVRVACHRVRKGRRGCESPSLFRSRSGRALGRKDVWRRIKVRCAQAGVDSRLVAGHSFRHAFVGKLNSKEAVSIAKKLFGIRFMGGDLLQKALRHKNRRTTEEYGKKPTEAQAGEVSVVLMARKLGYE